MVPLRQRGKYVSLISVVWAVGSVSGPMIGGALAQNNAWRWIFYLNLPIIAIGFVGVLVFLNLQTRMKLLREKLSEIDYVGSVIFVASSTSFLIPMTWGGIMYSWSSWRTLIPMLIGAGGLALFCLYEAKFAKHTLMPMEIFNNRSTSLCYFTTFIHGTILWSVLYYLPLYFEAVRGYNPIITGVAVLPDTLTVVPCAILVGFTAAHTGIYRWALWWGWALTTIGCGLLYLLDSTSNTIQCVILMLLSGIGLGLLFPSMALSIQASAPQEHIAIAAAMFTFFRAFGQTVGVAIGGVIFQNRITIELAKFPDLVAQAGKYSLDAVALVETIEHLPGNLPQAFELKTGFADALKIIWAVMSGFAGIALVASVFVESYDLNQALLTEQGFRDVGVEEKESRSDLEAPTPCTESNEKC
jgi:MFS family permease